MKQEVAVYGIDGKESGKKLEIPEMFGMDIRPDLIRDTFDRIRLNKRQPYAVSPLAGMQHSAESWGTGRARARVPRVKGSGTRRCGQGAFANFCRGGRMAHPTKVTRRWNRLTTLKQRRLVSAMAVAATANAAMVEGRGHRISQVPNIPLVVSDDMVRFSKTKQANSLLLSLGLGEDLERVKKSITIHPGKGKYRGRRYIQKKGVLIIHTKCQNLYAYKSITGVETMSIDDPCLLDLAPGGNCGRLVVWTESAFKKIKSIYGSMTEESEKKSGFIIPKPMISTESLEEYYYSPEIQNLVTMRSLIREEKKEISRTEAVEQKRILLSTYN